MKRSISLTAFVLFAAAFLMSRPVFAQEATLSGTISDQTASVLPGATVTVKTPQGTSTATTNAQGEFRMVASSGYYVSISAQDARDGSYLLDAAPTNPTHYFNARGLKADKTDVVISIRLRQLAPLTGKVSDGEGKPLIGMQLYVDSRLPAVTSGAGVRNCSASTARS